MIEIESVGWRVRGGVRVPEVRMGGVVLGVGLVSGCHGSF